MKLLSVVLVSVCCSLILSSGPVSGYYDTDDFEQIQRARSSQRALARGDINSSLKGPDNREQEAKKLEKSSGRAFEVPIFESVKVKDLVAKNEKESVDGEATENVEVKVDEVESFSKETSSGEDTKKKIISEVTEITEVDDGTSEKPTISTKVSTSVSDFKGEPKISSPAGSTGEDIFSSVSDIFKFGGTGGGKSAQKQQGDAIKKLLPSVDLFDFLIQASPKQEEEVPEEKPLGSGKGGFPEFSSDFNSWMSSVSGDSVANLLKKNLNIK